jgi:microcystin-dependent protein
MKLSQVKEYVTGVLKQWFTNKPILDKFNETETGELLYGTKTISSNPVLKYQKYLNTELDSCFCMLAEDYTPVVGECVPFAKKSGSFEVNEGKIIIKPGQRVQINISIAYGSSTSNKYGNIKYAIKDCTNNVLITELRPINNDGYSEYTESVCCQYTNETNANCEIGLYVSEIKVSDTIRCYYTSLTVQEIGRQIIIDPIEHINKAQGIEDAPVGHIISHMGNNAPAHYLICDGTEYTIEDYPDLAQHFIDEFGSVNCFGGDGVTTFAVPNINKNTSDAKNVDTYGLIPKMSAYSNSTCKVTQGSEYSTYKGYYAFDRNDTTAWISDKNPSKAASDYVQVQFIDNGHRKINKISLRNANFSSYNRCKDFVFQASDDGISFDTLLTDVLPDDSTKYYDYTIASNKTYTIFRIVVKSTYNGGSTYNYGLGDIRLFGTVAFPYAFIKYEPTYYMNIQNTNYLSASLYSEDERIIGSWINGKPLYEKTIIATAPQVVTNGTAVTKDLNISELNIDLATSIKGFILESSGACSEINAHNCYTELNNATSYVFYVKGILRIRTTSVVWNDASVYVTIRYTKTTDTENSFTNDMIKDYISSSNSEDISYTDEEIQAIINVGVAELNEEA